MGVSRHDIKKVIRESIESFGVINGTERAVDRIVIMLWDDQNTKPRVPLAEKPALRHEQTIGSVPLLGRNIRSTIAQLSKDELSQLMLGRDGYIMADLRIELQGRFDQGMIERAQQRLRRKGFVKLSRVGRTQIQRPTEAGKLALEEALKIAAQPNTKTTARVAENKEVAHADAWNMIQARKTPLLMSR